MSDVAELIPPPPVIRARLAEVAREQELLRALLRLSVRAAADRHELPQAQPAVCTAGAR